MLACNNFVKQVYFDPQIKRSMLTMVASTGQRDGRQTVLHYSFGWTPPA